MVIIKNSAAITHINMFYKTDFFKFLQRANTKIFGTESNLDGYGCCYSWLPITRTLADSTEPPANSE